MRSFSAFLKKEILDALRGGKLVFMGLLFLGFGIMNPAIAKLTPMLVELFADSLAETGMTITEIKVDALTSWAQFYKNIPMALIAFALSFGGCFTKEYESGTLVLILTKGMPRYKVVLSKLVTMLAIWTSGYWLCYGVTYLYNSYFWDNGIAAGLAASALLYYLFGVLVVCLITLFSTLTRAYSTVLIGTGGVVLLSYVVGMIPKMDRLIPTALTDTAALLTGAEAFSEFVPTVVITLVICAASVALSLAAMEKKQL